MINFKNIYFLGLLLSLNICLFAASEQPAYITLTRVPGSKNLQLKDGNDKVLKISRDKKIIKVIHTNGDGRIHKDTSGRQYEEYFLVDKNIDPASITIKYEYGTKISPENNTKLKEIEKKKTLLINQKRELSKAEKEQMQLLNQEETKILNLNQAHLKTDITTDYSEDGTYQGFREILESDPDFTKKIAERAKNEDVIEVVRSTTEMLKKADGTPEKDESGKIKYRFLPEKDEKGEIKYRYYLVKNNYSMDFESELAGLENVKAINSAQVISTEFNKDGTRKPRRKLIPYTAEELAAMKNKNKVATTAQPEKTTFELLAEHKNLTVGALSVPTIAAAFWYCYKNFKKQEELKNPAVKVTFKDFLTRTAPKALFNPLASIKDPSLQALTASIFLALAAQAGCLTYDAING